MEAIRALFVSPHGPIVLGLLGVMTGGWFGAWMLRKDPSPRPRLWRLVVRVLTMCIPAPLVYAMEHTDAAAMPIIMSAAAYLGGVVVSMVALTLLRIRQERERGLMGGR